MIEEIAIWFVLIAIGCGLLALVVFIALVLIAVYRWNKELKRMRTLSANKSSSVINVHK